MRLIGHLADEPAARTFADYLCVQGIENQIEFHKEEGWAVWINDEDKIQRATSLLEVFRQNPTDPKYPAAGKGAAVLRAKEEKREAICRKKPHHPWQLLLPLRAYGFGPLTFVLIAISVAVAIYSRLGDEPRPILSLFITDYTVSGNFLEWNTTLPELRHGQIWRLVTPIFIHFGLLHILFNLLWLRDLGSMIEGHQSSWRLAVLVLVIGACSNLAQFYYHGPAFGGMSGVVYGLLGYIWMRGRFDPGSGLFVQPATVIMMIIWFFACFTPIMPNVANACHAVGLVMGIAWGYLSSLRYR
jgi:GlpG protein